MSFLKNTRYGLASTLALSLAITGCGDDENGGGGDGGSAGEDSGAGGGGSGGDGGDGSGGSSTGGADGSGGASTGGTDAGVEAGTGGAEDDGGTEAGDTAPPLAIWGDGVTGGTIDAANNDRLWTPVFDEDNNLFATGFVETATRDSQVVVVKINTTTGALDTNWGGGDGMVLLNHSTNLATAANPVEEGRDIVVQDDKLVVVSRSEGAVTAANHVIVVYRLNKADGAADDTFGNKTITIGADGTPESAAGTAGKTVIDLGEAINDAVWSMDIDADGNLVIFAVGQSIAGLGVDGGVRATDQNRFIIRLTPDGDLDTTFAEGGIFTTDIPESSFSTDPLVETEFLGLNDNVRHGFVLDDGSIIGAGYTEIAGRNQIVLIKLTADGERDTTFSTDGVLRLAPFPFGMAEAYGAAIQDNGSFVTTGYGRVNLEANTSLELVSFRVTATGGFNPSWAFNGALAYDIANGEDRGRYALALPDNRVLMFGGGTFTAGDKDAMLLLLDENGDPAANFEGDGTGRKLYSFGDVNEEFYGGALSPDGTLVAGVGYATTNKNATVVVLQVGE